MNDAQFQAVIAIYKARQAAERAMFAAAKPGEMLARRDELLLEVGEPAARMLNTIVVARDAKVIVELGTSYGYSTLFLADAARATGGMVHSFELSGDKQAYAKQQIEAAGLAAHVIWHLGDAVELLAHFDEQIDFVLMDLWKELYLPCLELVYPRLAARGIIASDNMIDPPIWAEDIAVYRSALRSKPGIQTMLLPVGSGIEVSCFWPEG